jgi:aminoglycoside phosphotransferase (APT) family kinase protein
MSLPSSRLAEARARQALRASGLPYQGRLVRASSTRNEIFLTERHVVRVNSQLNQRLRREAQLYRFLPAEPWSPAMVAVGGKIGADYLIVERKRGDPLAHRWPDLSVGERRQAVRDLALRLQAIHATGTPGSLPPLQAAPHLLDGRAAPPVRPLLEGLDRLGADPRADAGVIAMAREYVVDNWASLEGLTGERLIHGDLTFENVLWDGHQISAVLDFEWCRGAPADLDLDVLLRCCALPEAHVGPDHQHRTRAGDYADVPRWLAEDYPELFGHPRLVERLTLYALSFDVRDALESPLPAGLRGASPIHPYNRLIDLIWGGGHVIELLRRVGVRA